MEETERERQPASPAKAADNFHSTEFFMIFSLVLPDIFVVIKCYRVSYNYITKMLKVKKIMEKWEKFDKIVRISGVKWGITFKNRLFLGIRIINLHGRLWGKLKKGY